MFCFGDVILQRIPDRGQYAESRLTLSALVTAGKARCGLEGTNALVRFARVLAFGIGSYSCFNRLQELLQKKLAWGSVPWQHFIKDAFKLPDYLYFLPKTILPVKNLLTYFMPVGWIRAKL